MAGSRRKARIIALQVLYEFDSTGHEPEVILVHMLENELLPEEAVGYARDVIRTVVQNRDMIDESIKRFAPAFPIEQIAIIDRNILRLAIFEILLNNKVPDKVAINEAVDLAKAFGSESSPKFVNGVLGAVVSASEKPPNNWVKLG